MLYLALKILRKEKKLNLINSFYMFFHGTKFTLYIYKLNNLIIYDFILYFLILNYMRK